MYPGAILFVADLCSAVWTNHSLLSIHMVAGIWVVSRLELLCVHLCSSLCKDLYFLFFKKYILLKYSWFTLC